MLPPLHGVVEVARVDLRGARGRRRVGAARVARGGAVSLRRSETRSRVGASLSVINKLIKALLRTWRSPRIATLYSNSPSGRVSVARRAASWGLWALVAMKADAVPRHRAVTVRILQP